MLADRSHCSPNSTPSSYIKEGRDLAIRINLIPFHPIYYVARSNCPYNRAYEYKKSSALD
jgi:hypothetical protein